MRVEVQEITEEVYRKLIHLRNVLHCKSLIATRGNDKADRISDYNQMQIVNTRRASLREIAIINEVFDQKTSIEGNE